MKTCPFCQKEIQDDAHKCKYCGGWFTNDAEDKQKILDREAQAKKLLQNKKDKSGEELSENTQCFSVSTKKMIVMSLITFGLYDVYWFYRNWRAIYIQENRKLSPFWRTVFSVFYCYNLFKQIIDSAVRKGYEGNRSSGVLAVVYIILVIISSKAPSPVDLIGILSFIPIIYVNNAVRFNNFKIDPQYQEKQPLTRGEVLFLIFGLIIWGLNIFTLLYPETSV